MGLVAELKRRNVIRVALAYAIIAWVIAQIAELAFDSFDAPAWVLKSVLVVLALGFPLALFFAWAFELTPEGMKKQAEVDSSNSITQNTGRKLDYLIIAVLVVAVGMLLIDKFVLQDASAPSAEKSVAVLPFVAMSNGPDDEYFADGLTEEILNSLAQLPELLVIARTSAFSFKGQDIPIPEIATTLGVAHVVEGSVRRDGDQLRITVQLVRANDAFHLWSETYDRASADILGVQGEIAEKIAAALDVVLDEEQREHMRTSGLRNPEAFIAYQKGVELYTRAHGGQNVDQIPGLALANVQFDRVLALEPQSAEVNFRYADYYIHVAQEADALSDGTERAASDAAVEAAKRYLKNGVLYARTDGERLSAKLEYALIAREWRRLPELYRSAVQSTGCVRPSFWGSLVALIGTSETTMALWERARACDPLNSAISLNISDMQLKQGDFAAAIATAEESIEVLPEFQMANMSIFAYAGAGDFDKALAANERLIDDPSVRRWLRLCIEAARGDIDTTRTLRDEIVEANGEAPFSLFTSAILGEREMANKAAAAMDARPLGFLYLLSKSNLCNCGAPFDLEFTPNFARLIDEAELVWPPPRPIDWPLKDW
jgi:adenylate cyclase